MSGTLYGIGLGPGDPELVTLKALRILREADVVAYPMADGRASLARRIAEPYLTPGQAELEIPLPMRTDRAPAQAAYDAAAEAICLHLDGGHDVALLCEGDPFFYGSFMYLFTRLADRYRTEIVPGVSSMMAAGAALGRPLAARNDRFTVIPGPLEDAEIEAALRGCEAAVILKVGRHFSRIRALLERLNLIGGAGYVERVTQPEEIVKPLREVPAETQAPYFSMIVVSIGQDGWTRRATEVLQ